VGDTPRHVQVLGTAINDRGAVGNLYTLLMFPHRQERIGKGTDVYEVRNNAELRTMQITVYVGGDYPQNDYYTFLYPDGSSPWYLIDAYWEKTTGERAELHLDDALLALKKTRQAIMPERSLTAEAHEAMSAIFSLLWEDELDFATAIGEVHVRLVNSYWLVLAETLVGIYKMQIRRGEEAGLNWVVNQATVLTEGEYNNIRPMLGYEVAALLASVLAAVKAQRVG
jgi:hypothetical protein